jgi:hypothetical protein
VTLAVNLGLMIGLVHFVEGKHAASTASNLLHGIYFMYAELKTERGIDTETNQYVGSLPGIVPNEVGDKDDDDDSTSRTKEEEDAEEDVEEEEQQQEQEQEQEQKSGSGSHNSED